MLFINFMILGSFQAIMNDKRSQSSIMNDIVNDTNGHNIVNASFAHKPDGLKPALWRGQITFFLLLH